ncbi:MAG: hypothetical protein PHF46_02870 [Candidatus Gracilibacteria bacterium]|nr:hypothetical protein [Candidatus Gracilibacteria bacterium]MDD3120326.1 hypothetical protein [Candidatus Gracilibacteria bacterium]MDD4530612.1 hypothetical protein [Candidatus Gracilibacteria bacterium]
MYKIYFSKQALFDVHLFVENLRGYYRVLYLNTGIYEEQKIIDSYMELLNRLYDEIIDKIYKIGINGLLGRNIIGDNDYGEVSRNFFVLRSFSIMFESLKVDDNDVIIIERIFINKI